MSNVKRWITGERNERKCAVDAATEIEVGDLLWLDTDDVKPASQLSDLGTERWNQIKFRNLFAGVAMEAHPANSSARTDFRVATSGIFEFIAASDTYEIGAPIAIDEASSGTALEDQTVVDADFDYMAIGRVARRAPSATTTLRIAIDPPIWRDYISPSSNWLFGERNESLRAVDNTTVIAINDMLWLDIDDVKPAADQVDQGSESSNQQLFHDTFAGIAMQAHASGGGAVNIRVAQTGVFLLTCPDEDRDDGDDLMGADENGAGNALLNTTVDNVSNVNACVGNLVNPLNSGTSCEVKILSVYHGGGNNAIA